MNALKYHWCVTSLLFQAILKHVSVVQRFHLQEIYVRDQSNRFCILPRMKKSMALFHIKKLSCHVPLLLKSKLQHVGHNWVVYGSHPNCSVGQMGQQVRPTDFQPWIGS